MSRITGWPTKMMETIDLHDRPFAWGTSDCMQFCLDVAEAITGKHPYPNAKPEMGVGRYTTQVGAMACLNRHGFKNIIEALHAAYPPVAVSLAQRGDIGIVSLPDGMLASCVCVGMSFVGKAPGQEKLIHIPRNKIVQAFKVG